MADLPPGPLYGLAAEALDRLRWDSDEQAAVLLKFDGQRCRLDLDEALPQPNIKEHAGLQPGLAAHFLGND